MPKITEVPIALVPVMWERVAHLLKEPISMSTGEMSEASVYSMLATGETSLVVITEGPAILMAMTLGVVVYESGKRELSIPLIGGQGLDNLGEVFMPFVESIAKRCSCSTVVGYAARKGWSRKLENYGWKSVREIIKYEVT